MKNGASVKEQYKSFRGRKSMLVLCLFLLMLALALLCINAGAFDISPVQVFRALFNPDMDDCSRVVRLIRLPRVIAAIVSGAGLALCGCVMQIVLKNPMASPSTMGVSNAAVFGANLAIVVLGAGSFHSTHGETLTVNNPYMVTILAFLFAMDSAAIILALSAKGGFSPETVVLAGIAFGSLFSAGTTIIQYFAIDTQVAAAVFWTFGDLGRAGKTEDIIMAGTALAALAYFYSRRLDYNAMANGEDVAKSLGVNTARVRMISLLLASLLCAVIVSFLGIIGFVGLIAPQAVKRITGSDYRYLIPASALFGSCLLLLSDTVARSVLTGVALPVGAITSILGGPMFLWMLLGRDKWRWKRKA